jgi:serine/threonine-protein kinase
MVGKSIGKYRIVERLGRGGMGTVYKAVDETLDRDVAVKLLNPGLAETDVLKRFKAEAMALARVNHPNIATIYELTVQGDELLMVIEFVRGETFDMLLERVGPMSFERAANLCGQVLDALGHAHRAGIVHRDLKPSNLMLAESGIVKVMDFGIARMVGAEHLTNDGFMMGTPAYMAPEQVMGYDLDGRADLYSIAVVLYRLLTGNLPFQAETAIAMAQKQIKDPPTPLRQFRAELPVWCEQILMKALAKDPGGRYQTAEEFRSALTLSMQLAPASDVTSVLAKATGPYPVVLPIADSGPIEAPAAAGPPPVASSRLAKSVTPIVFASPAPKAQDPTIVVRRSHLAFAAAVGAIVLLTGAAGVVLVLRRAPAVYRTTDAPPAPPPSAPAAASAAGGSVDSSAPTVTPPATTQPEAPSPSVAAAPRRQVTPPAPSRTSASQRGAANGDSIPAAATNAVPASVPDAPRVRSFPAVVFTPVRLLMVDGRARERESTLRLDSTALLLVDPDSPRIVMESVPYTSVIGLFSSRSREPRWVQPNGEVASVARVGGGMLGFLRGDRDWLTVRTSKGLVSLRADGDVMERVAAALEERTNLKVIPAPNNR